MKPIYMQPTQSNRNKYIHTRKHMLYINLLYILYLSLNGIHAYDDVYIYTIYIFIASHFTVDILITSNIIMHCSVMHLSRMLHKNTTCKADIPKWLD